MRLYISIRGSVRLLVWPSVRSLPFFKKSINHQFNPSHATSHLFSYVSTIGISIYHIKSFEIFCHYLYNSGDLPKTVLVLLFYAIKVLHKRTRTSLFVDWHIHVMMYFLTKKSDVDDKSCNMQKPWNSFYIEISKRRIVTRAGLFSLEMLGLKFQLNDGMWTGMLKLYKLRETHVKGLRLQSEKRETNLENDKL